MPHVLSPLFVWFRSLSRQSYYSHCLHDASRYSIRSEQALRQLGELEACREPILLLLLIIIIIIVIIIPCAPLGAPLAFPPPTLADSRSLFRSGAAAFTRARARMRSSLPQHSLGQDKATPFLHLSNHELSCRKRAGRATYTTPFSVCLWGFAELRSNSVYCSADLLAIALVFVRSSPLRSISRRSTYNSQHLSYPTYPVSRQPHFTFHVAQTPWLITYGMLHAAYDIPHTPYHGTLCFKPQRSMPRSFAPGSRACVCSFGSARPPRTI